MSRGADEKWPVVNRTVPPKRLLSPRSLPGEALEPGIGPLHHRESHLGMGTLCRCCAAVRPLANAQGNADRLLAERVETLCEQGF